MLRNRLPARQFVRVDVNVVCVTGGSTVVTAIAATITAAVAATAVATTSTTAVAAAAVAAAHAAARDAGAAALLLGRADCRDHRRG